MHSRIYHNMGQLFEVTHEIDSAHREQHSGGGSVSGRHLWWVLWLGAWAQFFHHKMLPQAWSSKTLFSRLENKYTVTMNYARIGRTERSTRGVVPIRARPEAGEVGSRDSGDTYALALR